MRPPVVPDPVFLLDYDGTLAEIAPRPELARPYPGVPGLLVALARRHPVYLVTGRRLADLERLLGPLGLPAFGVHGAEEGVLGGAVKSRVPEEAARAVRDLLSRLPRVPGLRVEDKGLALALHYRGAPDEAAVMAAIEPLLGRVPPGFEVIRGKKVVEIKPEGATKGAVAREVAARHPGRTPVAIGDDATDEAMFQALPHGVTIKVGPGPTAARYRLEGVPEVVRYLKQYLEGDEDQHA